MKLKKNGDIIKRRPTDLIHSYLNAIDEKIKIK